MLTRVPKVHALRSLSRSSATGPIEEFGNVLAASSPFVLTGQPTHSRVQRIASVSHNLTHKALLVDAAGTLFEPSEPVTEVLKE